MKSGNNDRNKCYIDVLDHDVQGTIVFDSFSIVHDLVLATGETSCSCEEKTDKV